MSWLMDPRQGATQDGSSLTEYHSAEDLSGLGCAGITSLLMVLTRNFEGLERHQEKAYPGIIQDQYIGLDHALMLRRWPQTAPCP